MFFIYSLDLTTLQVKLHDCCNFESSVDTLLDTVAKNFIRVEEGEKKAEYPYKDDEKDENVKEDGYFLRHCKENPQRIFVHRRQSRLLPGTLWNSYEVKCEKVSLFGVTFSKGVEPLPVAKQPSIKNTVATASPIGYLDQLKERLVLQKAKVESQMNIEPLQENVWIGESNSDAETETDYVGPRSRLEKCIANESQGSDDSEYDCGEEYFCGGNDEDEKDEDEQFAKVIETLRKTGPTTRLIEEAKKFQKEEFEKLPVKYDYLFPLPPSPLATAYYPPVPNTPSPPPSTSYYPPPPPPPPAAAFL